MLQEEIKLRLDFCVSVNPFGDDFICTCGFQFTNLSVQILTAFLSKRAAGETVILFKYVFSG